MTDLVSEKHSEVTHRRERKRTFTYSLKRVHCEVGVEIFLDAAVRLLTPRSAVLEEARVCMQDSTTLETATSLVSWLPGCLKEFLDSWKRSKRH